MAEPGAEIGRYAPDDVDVDVDVEMLDKIVATKLADGLSPAAVRLLMGLASNRTDLTDDAKPTSPIFHPTLTPAAHEDVGPRRARRGRPLPKG